MSRLMDIIKARSSTRKFQKRPVSEEIVAGIVEAARHAPSACHSQPWRFVAVNDPVLLEKLTTECLGFPVPNRWARQAPVILVVCASRKMIPNYLGEPAAGISYHQIDLGIAMEHVVLRAQEMGLGTCYIGWFKSGRVRRLLEIPRSWKIACLLALGYPSEDERTPRSRLPLEEILFFNKPGTHG
jgi:nitroreductase